MKTIRYIGLLAGLIIFLHSSQAEAQSNKEKEPDQKAAQEAELKAKKEMLEQQKQAMREQEIYFKEQQVLAEELAHSSGSSRARVIYRSPGDSDSYFFSTHDEGNQSQLTLRNTFKGGSDTSKGQFEVDEATRNFRLMIQGRVKSGEIRIKLLYPDGKVFKDQTINSSAEITLTQSIRIKEGTDSRYIGSWTYEVTSDEAMGDYSMSISTN